MVEAMHVTKPVAFGGRSYDCGLGQVAENQAHK